MSSQIANLIVQWKLQGLQIKSTHLYSTRPGKSIWHYCVVDQDSIIHRRANLIVVSTNDIVTKVISASTSTRESCTVGVLEDYFNNF